jgi:formyltetrahydrofolate-dependent phosphoribosylglycinamide formyltransferase
MTNAEEAGQPLRLGVLGSGAGSNLQALIQAIREQELNAQILAAISDHVDSGFLRIAQEAGLPAYHVDAGRDPRRFDESAQKKVLQLLLDADVDVVVLTGFMRILKEPLLSAFADRIVNVHPSLLPAYKGATAVQDVLDEGELETGCTVHLVNADIDAGKILAQTKVPILIGDNAQQLHARIKEQEHILLPKVLAEWKRT